MSAATARFEHIAAQLLGCLPRFTPDEQRLAHAIYHGLAEGRPVARERIAANLGWPGARIAAMLQQPNLACLTFVDDQRRILGFGGLAVAGDLPHRFRVNGRDLFAWCAWDSLFLPPILGATAEVESPPPDGRDPVRLVVRPDGVESVAPETAALSFILPTAAAFEGNAHQAMAAFCHYVHFFADRLSAEAWTGGKPDMFVLSIEEGFALGQRMNRSRWDAVMGDGAHDGVAWLS